MAVVVVAVGVDVVVADQPRKIYVKMKKKKVEEIA
jgi:hypothetical protein